MCKAWNRPRATRIILGAFLVLLAVGWLGFSEKETIPLLPSVQVVIPSGVGVNHIGDLLEEAGLLPHRWIFDWYVWFHGAGDSLRAGTYTFIPGISMAAVVSQLIAGAPPVEITVTIPEGWTLSQIGATLGDSLGISQADWTEWTGPASPVFALISKDNDPQTSGLRRLLKDKPDSADLHGYLFPDTYRFSPDAFAEDVVWKMLVTTERRLREADLWNMEENIHAWFTLASIVEREVTSDEDRGRVADIFLRRLAISMPLQADSTVNFVTGKQTPSISLEDRDLDSPYNTYRYAGLPPGPISHPGLSSLFAVMNPVPNDDWYFLTASDGTVYYAKTYEEHLGNKARYLP